MSTPVLEAVQAERGQLEERCAWHLAQLDRLEQQLEALKEIERLAERLGHGTAGEAPPSPAPGEGVSPARSVPKKRPAARQRPAQRTAAGPSRAPALHTVESGRQRREAVLDAIRAGHEKPAEICEATVGHPGIAAANLGGSLGGRAVALLDSLEAVEAERDEARRERDEARAEAEKLRETLASVGVPLEALRLANRDVPGWLSREAERAIVEATDAIRGALSGGGGQ